MTSMCVICYVCLNWNFTEIKVQRETRSRCKQERNEWSQHLKSDSELFTLSSYHHASCLCLMARAIPLSHLSFHSRLPLLSHLLLVLRTLHVWSIWPNLAIEGFIKRQNIQKTFFCFLYWIYFSVSTQLHILWTLKLLGTFCSQELCSSAQLIRTFLDLHR